MTIDKLCIFIYEYSILHNLRVSWYSPPFCTKTDMLDVRNKQLHSVFIYIFFYNNQIYSN